jgi:hypothetical protein
VLCIADARQKANTTRHLVTAWKDATLALGTQPRRNGQAALIAHYCVHLVECHGGASLNLPQAKSRFFMPLPISN